MPKQFLKPSINKWHTQNDSNRCQLLILNVTHGLCSIIRWKRTKKNENHNDVAHLLSLHQFKPFSFDAWFVIYVRCLYVRIIIFMGTFMPTIFIFVVFVKTNLTLTRSEKKRNECLPTRNSTIATTTKTDFMENVANKFSSILQTPTIKTYEKHQNMWHIVYLTSKKRTIDVQRKTTGKHNLCAVFFFQTAFRYQMHHHLDWFFVCRRLCCYNNNWFDKKKTPFGCSHKMSDRQRINEWTKTNLYVKPLQNMSKPVACVVRRSCKLTQLT